MSHLVLIQLDSPLGAPKKTVDFLIVARSQLENKKGLDPNGDKQVSTTLGKSHVGNIEQFVAQLVKADKDKHMYLETLVAPKTQTQNAAKTVRTREGFVELDKLVAEKQQSARTVVKKRGGVNVDVTAPLTEEVDKNKGRKM
jgi:hypothetical protein